MLNRRLDKKVHIECSAGRSGGMQELSGYLLNFDNYWVMIKDMTGAICFIPIINILRIKLAKDDGPKIDFSPLIEHETDKKSRGEIMGLPDK